MRELMREAADGKETNQDEINAVAQSQMTLMTPIMMLFLMFNMPGAIVLYYLLNNIITTALQKLILSRNLTEMESAAVFIVASKLHARAGTSLLVMANQERERLGLYNPVVHDMDQAIQTAIEGIRRLIREDRKYGR